MAVTDYNGKEKASLKNIKALWQYITGGGAQAIRKAMGLGDTLGPLQPECGGTGKNDSTGVGNIAYPVGSIYISVNSTNPSMLFGGTWEEIQGKFLLGRDSSHAAGSTGGEFNHTLTLNEMPSHSHSTNYYTNFDGKSYINNSVYPCRSHPDGDYTRVPMAISSQTSGGGATHNNTPPYLAVYIWKRVS